MHPENLIQRADVVKWMKWRAVWKTYVLIRHRIRPTKFGNQKEPKDQTHVTITKTLSQTLINNGNIVYCCVWNILFVFIFLDVTSFYIYVTRESLKLVTSTFNTLLPSQECKYFSWIFIQYGQKTGNSIEKYVRKVKFIIIFIIISFIHKKN